VLVLTLLSAYDARRNFRVVDEIGVLALGSMIAGIFLAGVLYLSLREISRFLFLTFLVLAFAFILTWRFLTRLAFRWMLLERVERRRVFIGRRRGGQGIPKTCRQA
jgi:FlaA1/EpsC-like NDP-sugar epimerase